jgi:hypothetical protein
MTTPSRSAVKSRNTALSAGIDKRISAPIQIGGVTYTPQALKAVFRAQSTAGKEKWFSPLLLPSL